MISYGSEMFRTKVVRHDLNPTWGEKFILHVPRKDRFETGSIASGSNGASAAFVDLSLLDWAEVTHDGHVGHSTLDISKLMDAAPKPDPVTGLYSVEAMQQHGFADMTLPLQVEGGDQGKSAPTIVIR